MTGLADRTSIYGFSFFTCGHLNNTAIPEWIATPGVEKFLVDILKMDPDDVARAFEHWGVLQGKSKFFFSFFFWCHLLTHLDAED